VRTPPLPIRGSRETADLLDRGGRPTLRELLSGLEFDAGSGALRLNRERMSLQPAEADRILRRELVQMLGEEEARIFLLRRGFRMGLHDAAFITRSWPALDRGDAFTAGPRVHQFNGIVRVETVYNDFDFARGRFAAEFLWHNSLEAEDGSEVQRLSDRPVCWQQLGYASGYATHFFGTLVVYKETACVAQGHRACRVVGRLATGWGDDDPDVILFRTRIAPGAPVSRRPPPAETAMPAAGSEALLLAPVLPALLGAAKLPLPCLIAGPGAAGQDVAAAQLLRLVGRAEGALHLRCAETTPEEMRSALGQTRRTRRKEGASAVVIVGVEELTLPCQAELARELAEIEGQARAMVILIAWRPLADLASGALHQDLWLQLAPGAIDLPEPESNFAALAAQRLAEIAVRLGLEPPDPEPELWEAIAADPPANGLAGLDALLKALLVESQGAAPDMGSLTRARARLSPCPLRGAGSESQKGASLIDRLLDEPEFSLPQLEAQLRAAAIERAGGNLAAAARLLGISRPQLAYRERLART